MTRPGRARRSLALASGLVILAHAGWWAALDHGPPGLRDPEYGKRLAAARRLAATGKPLVLVVGSSRVGYGVRPAEVAADPAAPAVANLALAGAGPVLELMAFRRALADGLNPRAVLVEYWPPFLRQDGLYREEWRIDRARLRPADERVVRDYFHEPDATRRAMRRDRVFGVSAHRRTLVNRVAPRWLPPGARTDGVWAGIDDTGWLVGRETVTADERERAWAGTLSYYTPLFTGYHVGADSDRALAELAAEARTRGVPVALVYLPESAAFRALMPPAVRAAADRHLAATAEALNAPVIDARRWADDDQMPDGFHLLAPGAAAFSRRLGPAILATLPGVSP